MYLCSPNDVKYLYRRKLTISDMRLKTFSPESVELGEK